MDVSCVQLRRRQTYVCSRGGRRTSQWACPTQSGQEQVNWIIPKGKAETSRHLRDGGSESGSSNFSLLHRYFEGSLSHRKLAVGDLGFGTLAHSVNNSTLRIFSLPGTCVYPLLRRSQCQTKAHLHQSSPRGDPMSLLSLLTEHNAGLLTEVWVTPLQLERLYPA